MLGIHPRHAPYMIRSVRCDKKDPLYAFMKDAGLSVEDAFSDPTNLAVFYFPKKAPEGSIDRTHVSAIEHLELWKVYAEHWCQHKPSITVNIKEHEWFEVGAWVFRNMDIMSGVSFLPYFEENTTYKQLPRQSVDKETFDKAVESQPTEIHWPDLGKYEHDDRTRFNQTYACTVCLYVLYFFLVYM